MCKFIVNTQLPPRLARFLRTKGYDAIHTTHFSEGNLLEDDEIVAIAKDQERTVVTKDSDFFDHFFLKGAPPKVLLMQFGNIANTELLELFDGNIEVIVDFFETGHELVAFKRDGIVAY
ncbi:MAG: DUF5615 family PIN-like protein [Chitinophagales bacterium]